MKVAETVEVCETFVSIQGESTYAGQSCFFVRLAGCNLSCSYCDTPQARTAGSGTATAIAILVKDCVASSAAIAEITGGEPLLQPGFRPLAAALRKSTKKPVLVETNGSRDISCVPADVVAIMDLKTPGSGMSDEMDMANMGRLRPQDEVKFVLTDRADYDWACRLTREHGLNERCHAVLFSPAFGRLEPGELGGWILADKIPARLQLQIHKIVRMR